MTDYHVGVPGYLRELGATEEEIVQAVARGQLGPLALDIILRPPGGLSTLEDVAARANVDVELVRRLWLAFGLPLSAAVPRDAASAVDALLVLVMAVSEPEALAFARTIGTASAQLASSLANTMRVTAETPQLDSGTPYVEVVRNYTAAARDLLPTLWDAIGAVFRRHLVQVSNQPWAIAADRSAVTALRTVGFVDLVASTTTLHELSVAQTARLVDEFERVVWETVTARGGQVVKLIGDEAMFSTIGAHEACEVALALVDASPHPIRVGLARGDVIAYHGDYYGPTVNLAARLVAAAPPGSVLVNDASRAGTDASTCEPFDTGPLRGFRDDVAVWKLHAAPK